MDKLKNKNQTSYIKERIIGENVRLVVEILHFCKENNEEEILTFTVFKTEYDLVKREFLFKTLKY